MTTDKTAIWSNKSEKSEVGATTMGKTHRSQEVFFSVIITCFNYEKYIAECIESVLSQSYKRFEVIVINDGSQDSSWQIISGYNKSIKAISTSNQGFIKACTLGLANANGTHMMFLDADDVLHPQALSVAARYMSDGKVAKVQFMMQPIGEDGRNVGRAFPQVGYMEAAEFFRDSIIQQGCYPTPPTSGNIYRRDIYDKVGKIDYDYGIDGVAYLFSPFIGRVIHVPEVLASYRIHGHNMSTKKGMLPETFARNAKVFVMRLEHLRRLIDRYSYSFSGFSVRDDYQYVIECKIYSQITIGRRPKFNHIFIYLKNHFKYQNISKSIAFALFTMILYLSPNFIARKLIYYRINQLSYPTVRSFLKKITHS